MKKPLILGLVALTLAAVAGIRCRFCNGTGFADKGKSDFTCSVCKGKGWR